MMTTEKIQIQTFKPLVEDSKGLVIKPNKTAKCSACGGSTGTGGTGGGNCTGSCAGCKKEKIG